MNKYYQTLDRILTNGKTQANKKGNIQYLLNEVLSMDATDLAEIFSEHKIAKSKLKAELEMYMEGITSVDLYNDAALGNEGAYFDGTGDYAKIYAEYDVNKSSFVIAFTI